MTAIEVEGANGRAVLIPAAFSVDWTPSVSDGIASTGVFRTCGIRFGVALVIGGDRLSIRARHATLLLCGDPYVADTLVAGGEARREAYKADEIAIPDSWPDWLLVGRDIDAAVPLAIGPGAALRRWRYDDPRSDFLTLGPARLHRSEQ